MFLTQPGTYRSSVVSLSARSPSAPRLSPVSFRSRFSNILLILFDSYQNSLAIMPWAFAVLFLLPPTSLPSRPPKFLGPKF